MGAQNLALGSPSRSSSFVDTSPALAVSPLLVSRFDQICIMSDCENRQSPSVNNAPEADSPVEPYRNSAQNLDHMERGSIGRLSGTMLRKTTRQHESALLEALRNNAS